MKLYIFTIHFLNGKTVWDECKAKNEKQAFHKMRLKYPFTSINSPWINLENTR